MKLCGMTTASPLLRSAAALALSDLSATLVVDIDDQDVTMRITEGLDILGQRTVPLAHSCITCSLREGVLPFIADLVDAGYERLVLALPVGAEAFAAFPGISDACNPDGTLDGVDFTCALHLVDADCAADDLFHHIPLLDTGASLFEGDDRCTGELLMNGIGYADLVCAIGDDGLGLDLVEHLRPLGTLMVRHFDELDAGLLFGGSHDADEAIARIHPLHTKAWGGPTDHGVWTLDLHSDRPFHPGRLAEDAASLAPEGVCARGCFWLPSRPTTVGTWEVTGGSIAVGTAGEWDEEAMTHIIVTGTGDSRRRDAVHHAFASLLMTDEEMADALEWVGADDGMSSWFEA